MSEEPINETCNKKWQELKVNMIIFNDQPNAISTKELLNNYNWFLKNCHNNNEMLKK